MDLINSNFDQSVFFMKHNSMKFFPKTQGMLLEKLYFKT